MSSLKLVICSDSEIQFPGKIVPYVKAECHPWKMTPVALLEKPAEEAAMAPQEGTHIICSVIFWVDPYRYIMGRDCMGSWVYGGLDISCYLHKPLFLLRGQTDRIPFNQSKQKTM